MSGLNLGLINSAENEFLSEQTMIDIVPNIDLPKLQFVSGIFGPLDSGMPCTVPLWLAITLRKRGKCMVITPDWMTIQSLEQRLAYERSENTLSDLPYHYMEIAQLLLTTAREEITTPDRVAVLLQDIQNIRMDRIKMGISNVANEITNNKSVTFAALNNVSAMEILTIKGFFLSSLEVFCKLCPPVDASMPQQSDYAVTEAATSNRRTLRRFRNPN
jgi:GINS complex subunit 2